MKKQLLLLLATIFTVNSYSQIIFERGYYVNNSNQKIDCLIKNVDWSNNPVEFEYKLTENAENKKANIKTVKEFGIYNVSRYLRANVNIDRSSEEIDKLSSKRAVTFNEEELFLEVLVQGAANLFSYKDGNLRRYFYNKENSIIEQLVFKKYKSQEDKIGENNRYKQQLLNNLICSKFSIDKVQNLDYKKKALVNFFVEYNECNNHEFINFEEKQKRDLFNLSIRPGFNNSSLSIQNSVSSSRDADFDNEFGFRFGIEAEFIMPFNKNKWAILIEPTYQSYKSDKELTTQNAKVNYKSIEVPVGIRHYFFLSENSKIFINGSLIFDFSDNSTIDFDSGADLEIETGSNLAFGLGYKHNNKYGLELRYQTSRKILRNYLSWDSDYNTVSVIVGYSIF